MAWPYTIGIVGGMGPHAHVELERRLLAVAVEGVAQPGDQDYPPWLLCSVPHVPDRSTALVEGGASPEPALRDAIRRLALAGADFAVVACNTAHAFLDADDLALPVLDLVDEALDAAVARHGPNAHLGLLGTTGTLRSALYPRRASQRHPDLRITSPLDLPDGEAVQAGVMDVVFGGIKAGALDTPRRSRIVWELERAAERLVDAGAVGVVAGCTEVSMALGRHALVVDPLEAAARAAVDVAAGRRPLPARARLAG